MRPGTIIYKEKLKIGSVILRYPKKTDLKLLYRYINKLSRERTFIIVQGERISLKQEKRYLDNQLQKIKEGKAVQLVVFVNNELVGNSQISLRGAIERHIGGFSISIAKKFRGQGLGKLLMKSVIAEAKKHLRGLEIIVLSVFADNEIAKKMYKKFGFRSYGMLPQGIKLEKGYANYIYMYKVTR